MGEKINPARNREPGSRTRMRFWLSARIGAFSIVLILYFLLVGCTTSKPDANWFPTSDPAWSTSEKEIELAEKFWNRRGISSYRIKVRVWGFWSDRTYSVVVHEGKVVDSSNTCVPVSASEPCPVGEFDPGPFTVPGLFAVAREKASLSRMTFDPYYGFPSAISYNHTAIADEEEEWTVLEFQADNR